jgi:hypothetical protein
MARRAYRALRRRRSTSIQAQVLWAPRTAGPVLLRPGRRLSAAGAALLACWLRVVCCLSLAAVAYTRFGIWGFGHASIEGFL